MKKPLACLAGLAALGLLGCGAPGASYPRRITVLVTGFMRGQMGDYPRRAGMGHAQFRHFGGAARMSAFVAHLEEKYARQGQEVVLVDVGDFLSGSPEAAVTRGGVAWDLMARRGYDAVLIGNREFNFGVARLLELSGGAGGRVPLVSSNLRTRAATGDVNLAAAPPWVRRFALPRPDRVRGAVRILGLSPVDLETLCEEETILGLGVDRDVARVVQDAAPNPLDETFTILLSQLDVGREREALAGQVAGSGVDLVIGQAYGKGNDMFLERGVAFAGLRNDVPGSAVAALSCAVDPHTGRVLDWSDHYDVLRGEGGDGARRRAAREAEPGDGHGHGGGAEAEGEPDAFDPEQPIREDDGAMAVVRPYVDELGGLERVVATVETPLEGGYETESSLGNLIADAFRASVPDCDAALLSAGIANHRRIPPGDPSTDAARLPYPLKERELYEVYGYENKLLAIDLTGAELEAGIRQMMGQGIHYQFSGMKLTWRSKDGLRGEPVGPIELGGAPVDPARTYKVAMDSFAYRRNPVFAKRTATNHGACRERLMTWMTAHSPLRAATDGRFLAETPVPAGP